MRNSQKSMYLAKYNEWLRDNYIDIKDREELKAIQDNEDEIQDRFFKDLEFGTGGLRGVIGIGTNRINVYTVRKATQGLSDFIINNGKIACKKGVAIAYDSRHYSDVFAQEAALVLAGNGIKVYLFESLRSTPELSFTVRHLECFCGIVITASHNPAEYNGYKVYNKDGGQITLNIADRVCSHIKSVDSWDKIKRLDEHEPHISSLIKIIGCEVDEAYITKVVELVKGLYEPKDQSDLKLVYTSLHGTGLMPIVKCLNRMGFNNIKVLEEQAEPNGDFPTVKSPNPEEHSAFELAIKEAEKTGAEVAIGTDPDCDRIGIVVKNKNGEYKVLTGNQIGALLVDFVAKFTANIKPSHTVIKTIVTSDLGAKIAESYGASVIETLTGFKFIGEQISLIENSQTKEFLFGYEESYGYLAGTFVRDKDAVIACCLIVAMISYYKQQSKSLFDVLMELYKEHGYHIDHLDSFVFKGVKGKEKIKAIMSELRNTDKLITNFEAVLYIEDYLRREVYNAHDKRVVRKINLPVSDVAKVVFDDGSWFAVRPSGTEPKLKVYYSVIGSTKEESIDKLNILRESIEIFLK